MTVTDWPSLFQTALRVVCFLCVAPDNEHQNPPLTSESGPIVNPTVVTPYGPVNGIVFGATNITAEGFFGIPYAKPPVGNLRFQKPEAPEKWTKPLNGSEYSPRCAAWPIQILQSEDCLSLNVIRPRHSTSNDKLPVMVWIHGGGFQSGSSRDYHRENFADRFVSAGIIVVSINYRLGPFGFLSTGNDFALGNYGLWDQVQALTFIQEVIPSFGGDPKQVTIFGESAGGASVSWLTLRPETESLFSKAISMSGSAHAIWANTEGTVKTSRAVIRDIGCDKVEDLPKCLQSASLEAILNATQKEMQIDGSFLKLDNPDFSHWNPRLDGDFISDNTFKSAIKNAPKRPQLIGLNSQESIYFTTFKTNETGGKYLPIPRYKVYNYSRTDFAETIKYVLGTEDAFGTKAKEASEAIIDWYEFHENYKHDIFAQRYVQVFSDIQFNVPALREAVRKAKAGNQNIYVYENTYVSEPYGDKNIDGSNHGGDLNVLLYGLKKDSQLTREFAELVVNFVKAGKPYTSHVTAQPVDPSKSTKIPFVRIDVPQISAEADLWSERLAFWDDLAAKYGFDWPLGRETE
uniref:Carboxylic ester hydrolase n=1 Tax=Panagrellus redivivus TaxID=6233 RepID=A0A7E4W432_PANRE